MTFTQFACNESGAVAVDWVVLTGGLVGLGIATLSVVSGGIENLSGDIGQELANIDVTSLPFGAAVAATMAAIPALLYMSEADFNEVVASFAGSTTQDLHDQLAWYHADLSGRAAGNENHPAVRQHVDMVQAIAHELNSRGEPTPEQATDIQNQYASYYD